MISLIVKYKVKDDYVEIVKGLVRKFVTRVKDNEPETLVYESYQLEDKKEFVHFMKFQSREGEEFHRSTKWAKEFVDSLYPLCERKPEFIELDAFY
jgi:quinol monooxygenase YgiN